MNDPEETGGPLQFLADTLVANRVEPTLAAQIVSAMASAIEVTARAADMNAWRQCRAEADAWRDELTAKLTRSRQLYNLQADEAWAGYDVWAAVRARAMADGLAVAVAILAESRTSDV
jgi:hypothetical protein